MLRDFRIAGLVLMALGLVGCDSSDDLVTDRTPTGIETSPVQLQAQPMKYLPYGVPIPVGQVITAPPEPYDPVRHGAPLPDAEPEKNEASRLGVDQPMPPKRRPVTVGNRPLPSPINGDAGYFIRLDYGMTTAHDTQLDLFIPNLGRDVFIYAPTFYPSGYSCLEGTTAHIRWAGNSTISDYYGFWNWCAPRGQERFTYWRNMNDNASGRTHTCGYIVRIQILIMKILTSLLFAE
jgi:hypothetical protein